MQSLNASVDTRSPSIGLPPPCTCCALQVDIYEFQKTVCRV
jgi:hypothetical protein